MFLPRHSMTGLLTTVPGGGGEAVKNRRSLLLTSVTFLYLTLGAALFSMLEYEADMRLRAENARREWQMRKKYNFSRADYAKLERVIVQSIPYAAGRQWHFLGSLYFCTVVITTIGYGHSTPTTRAGKLFCMLYALGGIPLGLVMFQSVGERINHFIGLALDRIGRWLKHRWHIQALVQIKSRHLLLVSFAIGWLTISVATGVFHQRENWSIFDAAYYCMITLSTIGFGDFVPAQTQQRLLTEPGYVLFTLFFILFGLAIFSACINLLILECMAYNADIVTARTRLKRMISVRMSSSFRIVTGQNGANASAQQQRRRGMMQRARAIRRREQPPNLARKAGVVVEKIEENGDLGRKRSRSASLSLLRDIYRRYYWAEPTKFSVRRLPTPYIEHLVNTSGKDSIEHKNGFVHRL